MCTEFWEGNRFFYPGSSYLWNDGGPFLFYVYARGSVFPRVCIHMGIHIYAGGCARMCLCMEATGQSWGIFLRSSLPWLRQDLGLEVGLADAAGLAGSEAPGIHPAPCPQPWASECASPELAFYVEAGDGTVLSMIVWQGQPLHSSCLEA